MEIQQPFPKVPFIFLASLGQGSLKFLATLAHMTALRFDSKDAAGDATLQVVSSVICFLSFSLPLSFSRLSLTRFSLPRSLSFLHQDDLLAALPVCLPTVAAAAKLNAQRSQLTQKPRKAKRKASASDEQAIEEQRDPPFEPDEEDEEEDRGDNDSVTHASSNNKRYKQGVVKPVDRSSQKAFRDWRRAVSSHIK